MKRCKMQWLFVVLIALVFSFPPEAFSQKKPILVGFPQILSGGGALFGQPALTGAQMAVKEINDKGGILGRPLELVVRDTKGSPEEAIRVSKELILKEKVEFLVGGLTSAEGLAISEVAKTEKVLYIAPISKTTTMTDPERLHPYVFRTATNTRTEGRSAAVYMSKLPAKRIYTIGPDYELGHVLTKSFVDWLKKIKPEVEIIGQGWPKQGEPENTPFITACLAARPEAVFTSLWGGHFVTFAKQAKPLGFFEKVKLVAALEAGSTETAKSLKDDLPLGITANSYDTLYFPGTPAHKAYVDNLKAFSKDEHPPSFAITGYVAVYFLSEAIKKANSTDTMKVIEALRGLTIDTPHGKLNMRAKDHQANRGQFWGTTAKAPEYPFPILRPVQFIPADDLMD